MIFLTVTALLDPIRAHRIPDNWGDGDAVTFFHYINQRIRQLMYAQYRHIRSVPKTAPQYFLCNATTTRVLAANGMPAPVSKSMGKPAQGCKQHQSQDAGNSIFGD